MTDRQPRPQITSSKTCGDEPTKGVHGVSKTDWDNEWMAELDRVVRQRREERNAIKKLFDQHRNTITDLWDAHQGDKLGEYYRGQRNALDEFQNDYDKVVHGA